MCKSKTGGTVCAESTALEGAFSENEKGCRLGKSKSIVEFFCCTKRQ